MVLKILIGIFCTGIFVSLGVLSIYLWVQAISAPIYQHVSEIPTSDHYPIAIVFGAGVRNGNEPSPVLYDRMVTASNLYKAGRVKKLLLTGDNSTKHYNEPLVMKNTALSLGIPEKDLVLDFAGRRTYDSCYRAIHIFGIKKAILVTQAFHLNRALYLSKSLGIDSIGVAADQRIYPLGSRVKWKIREIIATARAWININILPPKILLGEKNPID